MPFDFEIVSRETIFWIPAFAGMTMRLLGVVLLQETPLLVAKGKKIGEKTAKIL